MPNTSTAKQKTRGDLRCNDEASLPAQIQSANSRSLHLVNNLLCLRQTLDHLLAFLPPADCVFALLEQVLELGVLVHVLEELALHFFPCVSVIDISITYGRQAWNKKKNDNLRNQIQHNSLRHHIDHRPPHNPKVAGD